jgi:hypothetical protein
MLLAHERRRNSLDGTRVARRALDVPELVHTKSHFWMGIHPFCMSRLDMHRMSVKQSAKTQEEIEEESFVIRGHLWQIALQMILASSPPQAAHGILLSSFLCRLQAPLSAKAGVHACMLEIDT